MIDHPALHRRRLAKGSKSYDCPLEAWSICRLCFISYPTSYLPTYQTGCDNNRAKCPSGDRWETVHYDFIVWALHFNAFVHTGTSLSHLPPPPPTVLCPSIVGGMLHGWEKIIGAIIEIWCLIIVAFNSRHDLACGKLIYWQWERSQSWVLCVCVYVWVWKTVVLDHLTIKSFILISSLRTEIKLSHIRIFRFN